MPGHDTLSPWCSAPVSTPASIVFKTELGDLPLVSVASTDGVVIRVTEVEAGTKLDAECSRHGHCDSATGECVCFEGWGSSDGDGRVGHRLDCGWFFGEAGVLNAT